MKRPEIESLILQKAAEDPAFRQELKANPRQALAGLLPFELPSDLEVSVFEESATRLCLVLPAVESELSDEDLAGVAGGSSRPETTKKNHEPGGPKEKR